MNGGCRVAVMNEAGFPYATMDAGPHEWRLLSREKEYESEFFPQGDTGYARAYGSIEITPVAWKEVWYCTRCRLVEERKTPL